MLKGVLSLLLLRLLGETDGYGYGIVSRLQEEGFPDLVEGTVYPALTRLEAAGHLDSYLLRSSAGPARKYYRLNDSGRCELTRAEQAWADLTAAVNRIGTAHHPANRSQPQEA